MGDTVEVQVDIPDDVFMELARAAHEKNIIGEYGPIGNLY